MNKAETLYYGSQLYSCVRELCEWTESKLLSSKHFTKLNITEVYENELESYSISGNFDDFIEEFEQDEEFVKEIYDMVESGDFNFNYKFEIIDGEREISIELDLKGGTNDL